MSGNTAANSHFLLRILLLRMRIKNSHFLRMRNVVIPAQKSREA